MEKGEEEEDDETVKACEENAENDSRVRAKAEWAEKEPEPGQMRTQSTHGRIDPFHINKDQDEVP